MWRVASRAQRGLGGLTARHQQDVSAAFAVQFSRQLSLSAAARSDAATATAESAAATPPPFKKILVANRGEIACRVIRTCKRMGIKSVAVHSTVDAHSRFVREADEAVCIGTAASADSYLRIDRILDAIKQTGAEAVHPGYGFLSENMHFADQLEEMGVAFIGPKKFAIEAMGDKIHSKLLAKKAGVNVIPGFDGVIEDAEQAVKVSQEIGYPVMIKASAGGGGKGMRMAYSDQEVREGYALSQEEARSSFGDDRMLVEKFVEKPRHIEIQVLADTHGNAIYLNERECSVQRRNQKVVEEAPSTFLDAETRAAMGAQAVALCKAVDYCSAGTVEMLVDKNRNFYFLEMNTRLQVEHPVTEYITGVDLVEQMVKVAAGQPLDYAQKDIGIKGWAVESRVYAEDPLKYLPSIGRLSTYVEPTDTSAGAAAGEVRVDSGIVEGSEISMYYDPMISKLVTYGPDRNTALRNMGMALDSYVIKGVTHNIPLLRDIITRPRFVAGDIDTDFLPQEYPDGFHGRQLSPGEARQLVGVATFMHLSAQFRRREFTNQRKVSEVLGSAFEADDGSFDFVVSVGEEDFRVNAASSSTTANALAITVDGEPVRVSAWWPVHGDVCNAVVDGEPVLVQHDHKLPDGRGMALRHLGSLFSVHVRTPRERALFALMPEKVPVDTSSLIMSPMPGVLKSVAVREGDMVSEGAEVAVVEAMKMQNSLRAQRSGKVKKVHVVAGATLANEDIILEFEDETVAAEE